MRTGRIDRVVLPVTVAAHQERICPDAVLFAPGLERVAFVAEALVVRVVVALVAIVGPDHRCRAYKHAVGRVGGEH